MPLDVEDYYRRYGPMVLRRCQQLLRDEAKAADTMHDVFVELVRHERALEGRAPSSLLNRIATHLSLNRLRNDAHRDATTDPDVLHRIAHAEDLESRTVAGRLLDRLFQREQPSTRTLAVLHLVDGMTLEEVAAEVGLSVSGVRKRLRVLRERLHQLEETPR